MSIMRRADRNLIPAVERLERRECLTATVEPLVNINAISPFVEVLNTAGAGDSFYMIAAQSGMPRQLWKTNGTTDSTIALTNLGTSVQSEMANVNGLLYFVGSSPTTGEELWRTDGTVSGTRLVKDLTAGTGSSEPLQMFPFDNKLYFTNRGDLHVSDGTPSGTRKVGDLFPGIVDNVKELTRVQSSLYFTAGNSSAAFGLYKTDGTTITPIASLPSGFVSDLELVGTNLFFRYNDELWKLDTNTDTPSLVSSIIPVELTEMNGLLYFADQFHLWKSDGTEAGTSSINLVSNYPGELTNFQGVLYFAAGDFFDYEGRELWRSDGTARGTFLLKDIDPDSNYPSNGDGSYPGSFTNFNGQLVFTTSSSSASGLWTTDGTEVGTVPMVLGNVSHLAVSGNRLLAVRNADTGPGKQLIQYTRGVTQPVIIDPPGPDQGSSSPGPVLELNGQYYLFADDGNVGRELFRLNSDNSLTLIKDISSGPANTGVQQFTKVGNQLFFTANDPQLGLGLYRTDGTAAGTVRLKSFFFFQSYLVGLGNQVFFAVYESNYGGELWKSDGTVSGTVLVKDILPGDVFGYSPYSSDPEYLTPFNGLLYFSANDGQRELWQTDGTLAGTKLAVDIYAGTTRSSDVRELKVYQNQLYFAATDATGLKLFRSNGTAAGTVAVSSAFQSIEELTVAGGSLYFVGKTATAGVELWKVTGNGRPVMVKDIRPGSGSSFPHQLFSANGLLYFVADDQLHGVEAWQTNGTAAGTVMIRDIRPGTSGSDPHFMRALNGVLFFSANDGVHGSELWQTNGAVSGARLVEDINPGEPGSFPAAMTQRGNELLFRAYNPAIGTELFRVRSSAPVMTLPTTAAPYRGAPVRLAPQATLVDADSPIMWGGQLSVSLGNTYRTFDQLIIANTSTVSVANSRVSVNGIVVGVITYLNNNRDLSVLFNQNATRNRVREVLRAVAYTSRTSQPIASTRIVRFDLRDGDGGQANHRAVRIDVS